MDELSRNSGKFWMGMFVFTTCLFVSIGQPQKDVSPHGSFPAHAWHGSGIIQSEEYKGPVSSSSFSHSIPHHATGDPLGPH